MKQNVYLYQKSTVNKVTIIEDVSMWKDLLTTNHNLYFHSIYI